MNIFADRDTVCIISFWGVQKDKVRMLLYQEVRKNHYKYQGRADSNKNFFFEAELKKGHYIIIV